VDANNDSFTINVDGVSSGPINLTQNTYNTAAELGAEIQSRINADSNLKDNGVSVAVTFDSASDSFTITSSRYGSASAVAFTSVDVNTSADLGFDTTLTGTNGVDVQGSIGGVTATGNGRILTGNGDTTGVKLEITGGSTGNRGSLVFSRGIADQLSRYINNYMDNDIIGDRISGIQSSIDDIGQQRDALDRRLASLESRLKKRFTALDVLVNKLQSSGNYLTQQLNKLNGTLSKGN
jgi:flagellar hook-associated protein 2